MYVDSYQMRNMGDAISYANVHKAAIEKVFGDAVGTLFTNVQRTVSYMLQGLYCRWYS